MVQPFDEQFIHLLCVSAGSSKVMTRLQVSLAVVHQKKQLHYVTPYFPLLSAKCLPTPLDAHDLTWEWYRSSITLTRATIWTIHSLNCNVMEVRLTFRYHLRLPISLFYLSTEWRSESSMIAVMAVQTGIQVGSSPSRGNFVLHSIVENGTGLIFLKCQHISIWFVVIIKIVFLIKV